MPEAGQPRVLFVTRNMPPLVGGMERLAWHLADQLARRSRLEVVGPRGAATLAPSGMVVHEMPLRPLPLFLARAAVSALRLARAQRPDVVIGGSGLVAPLVEMAAKASGAAAACYVHGLDIVIDNPVYRAIWVPSIRRMDRVIANSLYTARLCGEAGVRESRIGIVHPGVALPPSAPIVDAERVGAFRARHGLADGPCLLSVGRLTARKGLREFVKDVLPRVAARHPRVRLLVAGSEASHALHSERLSPAELKRAAAEAGVGQHLVLVGPLSDADLDDAWSLATAHVFPLTEIPGDPEGFGMVAVEAAARGVPTVAYAVGGVPDALFDGVSGTLVRPGDADAFAAAVEHAIEGRFDPAAVRGWAERFAWDRFGDAISGELTLATSGRGGPG